MLSVFFAFLSPWDYTRDHKDAITSEISLLRIKLIFTTLTFEQFTVNSRIDIVYDVIWRFLTLVVCTSLATFRDICWYVCQRCHCRTSAFSSIIFHSFISRERVISSEFSLTEASTAQISMVFCWLPKAIIDTKGKHYPLEHRNIAPRSSLALTRYLDDFSLFAIYHYTSYFLMAQLLVEQIYELDVFSTQAYSPTHSLYFALCLCLRDEICQLISNRNPYSRLV